MDLSGLPDLLYLAWVLAKLMRDPPEDLHLICPTDGLALRLHEALYLRDLFRCGGRLWLSFAGSAIRIIAVI